MKKMSRFNLLCLDEGELLFEDFASSCHLPPSVDRTWFRTASSMGSAEVRKLQQASAVAASSTSERSRPSDSSSLDSDKIRWIVANRKSSNGRLKVGSKNLLFVPTDIKEPIVKVPYSEIQSIHVSKREEELIVLSRYFCRFKEFNVVGPHNWSDFRQGWLTSETVKEYTSHAGRGSSDVMMLMRRGVVAAAGSDSSSGISGGFDSSSDPRMIVDESSISDDVMMGLPRPMEVYDFGGCGVFVFKPSYARLDDFVALIAHIYRINQLLFSPASSSSGLGSSSSSSAASIARQKLQQLIQERERRVPFDSSWFKHVYESKKFPKPIIASQLRPLVELRGQLQLTQKHLYFQPFHSESDRPMTTFSLRNIEYIHKRRHLMRHVALEFIFSAKDVTQRTVGQTTAIRAAVGRSCASSSSSDASASFIASRPPPPSTAAPKPSDTCVSSSLVKKETLLLSFASQKDRDFVYETSMAQECVSVTESPSLLRMQREWLTGRVSNFDYLMFLNQCSGRSFNDLTQYPVFPWVLSDYTSTTIDLNNPLVYRDLSKPVGALNEERLERFKMRFEQMPADNPGGRFMYGTHYSTPGYVIYFLVRQFPEYMLRFQNGKFDAPDRLFSSVERTWNSALNSLMDVKELIPQFYMPNESSLNSTSALGISGDLSSSEMSPKLAAISRSTSDRSVSARMDSSSAMDLGVNGDDSGCFLRNYRRLKLGFRSDHSEVNHVDLPPWAEGSAEVFLKIMREALESPLCSRKIHAWIDLVFGFRQRGKPAVESFNVFHPLTYEGAVDIDSITDETERMGTLRQIEEFGQTPGQLFTAPHPQRRAYFNGEEFISLATGRPIISEHGSSSLSSLSTKTSTHELISSSDKTTSLFIDKRERSSSDITAVSVSSSILSSDLGSPAATTVDQSLTAVQPIRTHRRSLDDSSRQVSVSSVRIRNGSIESKKKKKKKRRSSNSGIESTTAMSKEEKRRLRKEKREKKQEKRRLKKLEKQRQRALVRAQRERSKSSPGSVSALISPLKIDVNDDDGECDGNPDILADSPTTEPSSLDFDEDEDEEEEEEESTDSSAECLPGSVVASASTVKGDRPPPPPPRSNVHQYSLPKKKKKKGLLSRVFGRSGVDTTPMVTASSTTVGGSDATPPPPMTETLSTQSDHSATAAAASASSSRAPPPPPPSSRPPPPVSPGGSPVFGASSKSSEATEEDVIESLFAASQLYLDTGPSHRGSLQPNWTAFCDACIEQSAIASKSSEKLAMISSKSTDDHNHDQIPTQLTDTLTSTLPTAVSSKGTGSRSSGSLSKRILLSPLRAPPKPPGTASFPSSPAMTPTAATGLGPASPTFSDASTSAFPEVGTFASSSAAVGSGSVSFRNQSPLTSLDLRNAEKMCKRVVLHTSKISGLCLDRSEQLLLSVSHDSTVSAVDLRGLRSSSRHSSSKSFVRHLKISHFPLASVTSLTSLPSSHGLSSVSRSDPDDTSTEVEFSSTADSTGVSGGAAGAAAAIGDDHTGSASSSLLPPPLAVIGSWDNNMYVYNAHTNKVVQRVNSAHSECVSSLSVSPDCQSVCSGGWDATVRLWPLLSNGQINSRPLVTYHLGSSSSAAAASASASTLSTSSRMIPAGMDDLSDDSSNSSLSEIRSVQFSRVNPNLLCAGDEQGIVRLFDTRCDSTSSACVAEIQAHSSEVTGIEWLPGYNHHRPYSLDSSSAMIGGISSSSSSSSSSMNRCDEFVTVSTDGFVKHWDSRKMVMAVHTLMASSSSSKRRISSMSSSLAVPQYRTKRRTFSTGSVKSRQSCITRDTLNTVCTDGTFLVSAGSTFHVWMFDENHRYTLRKVLKSPLMLPKSVAVSDKDLMLTCSAISRSASLMAFGTKSGGLICFDLLWKESEERRSVKSSSIGSEMEVRGDPAFSSSVVREYDGDSVSDPSGRIEASSSFALSSQPRNTPSMVSSLSQVRPPSPPTTIRMKDSDLVNETLVSLNDSVGIAVFP